MATALRYSDLEKLGVAGQLPRRIARTLLIPIYPGEASLQANLVLATSDDRPSMVSCYLAELLDGLGLVNDYRGRRPGLPIGWRASACSFDRRGT